VIATGFKDSDMRRRQAEAGPALCFVTKPDPEPDFEPEAPPMVMEQHQPERHAAAPTERDRG